MKKIFLLTLLFVALFTVKAPAQQYGVDVLKLDKFDFNLNMERFFQDEHIFRVRGKSKFFVSVSEKYIYTPYFVTLPGKNIDTDTLRMVYQEYQSSLYSPKHPLASYADVKFDALIMSTDDSGDNLLEVIGKTDYAKPEDVIAMIDSLIAEFGGQQPVLYTDDGIALSLVEKDRVVTFSINIMLSFDKNKSQSDETTDNLKLTLQLYNQIKNKLKEQKEVRCKLTITKSDFDKLQKENTYIEYW